MAFQELARPHIDSFNFAVGDGLRRILKYLEPLELQVDKNNVLTISIDSAEIRNPKLSDSRGAVDVLYPNECRRRGLSYTGKLQARLKVSINDSSVGVIDRCLGELPIMLCSRVCNLHGMTRKELMKHREEPEAVGGYFVMNGKERVIRMLIMPRRNYPLACVRSGFKSRGPGYTENSVIVRSVREDETAAVNILHWRSTGEPVLAFTHERSQFFVPISIILRALVGLSEMEIFNEIVRDNNTSLSLDQAVMVTLSRLNASGEYSTQLKAQQYIGRHFRTKMRLPESYSDEEVAKLLFKKSICIHLRNDLDKFNLLCLMFRKLHALVSGECCEESNDSLMFQEVLLPGHLYLQVLKDKMEQWLSKLGFIIQAKMKKGKGATPKMSTDFITSVLSTVHDLTQPMSYFIQTGNLVSSNIAVSQTSGLTITADNVNMLRFLAHFRAIHRGAFFAEMRTTAVRKLLPECWGFICPVHTPDGAPCGLLNHLSVNCRVVTASPSPEVTSRLTEFITENGSLSPIRNPRFLDHSGLSVSFLPVVLDGKLLGWVEEGKAKTLADWLRDLKSKEDFKDVPMTMEIALIPRTEFASQFPGLFLFTGSSRLLRPVHRVDTETGERGCQEWVGSLEQPYMDIAVSMDNGFRPGFTTHIELSPEAIFSFNASLIPFPNYNQSPRNMYQCQMGKQTMGHSSYTWKFRSDNKMYRLLTPQSPLVRTEAYEKFGIDNYPLGFNAVVAVMSYTGYDMEDAMVINKASYERGFAAACIYKSQVIDLTKLGRGESRGRTSLYEFGSAGKSIPGLDVDGFPPIGQPLEKGSPLYVYFHQETREPRIEKYKDDQQAFVEAVTLNGSKTSATLTLRVPRNPDIGDKYSSRHGQKGVNSLLVSPEDLPWTSNGIVPDLIFNPHGFPTRMTMGMMIEFLAGKMAALTGKPVDCTAFRRDESEPPYHDYAKVLQANGFNYWCTEKLISGTTGREIEADIFMGVVYYQRLRHMVADKFQVRSVGRVDQITRQPVKGRKVGGGIRLGEMERDCLLAHGAFATLQDRLLDCNPDKVIVTVCNQCGGMVHTDFRDETEIDPTVGRDYKTRFQQRWYCRFCAQEKSLKKAPPVNDDADPLDQDSGTLGYQSVRRVAVSHVLRYLIQELAGMNIRICVKVTDLDTPREVVRQ